jgi:hypothetical protein
VGGPPPAKALVDWPKPVTTMKSKLVNKITSYYFGVGSDKTKADEKSKTLISV